MRSPRTYDAIVVGAGHNGLVAATLLARAGQRVLVLERRSQVGGAAVSESPFPGVDVRLSRYSYLVSLFPRALLQSLGIGIEMRRRRISSYTPSGETGVLVCDDTARTRRSLARTIGDAGAARQLDTLGHLTTAVAQRTFASLTEPLADREAFRAMVADDTAWEGIFERPLSELLETCFDHDLVRGIVATDALIGTFAPMDDPQLRQNRCFLYHVIGNGTGRWDVPVGGMGALSGALAQAARRAGANLVCDSPVIAIESDGVRARVVLAGGREYTASHVLCGAAPSVLARLLGDPPPPIPPEGSQLKLNMLLSRLPALRDPTVTPTEAFGGTFHVNESYEQLAVAYSRAAAGEMPELPPCEAYCHSLTDPSILSPQLRGSGAHTLTVFVLHMPARLFAGDHDAAEQAATRATLRSLDSVLAEPIEDCLMTMPNGEPCLEVRTPVALEAELGLPAGHIFHRDLSWPFAESTDDVGRWGVETSRPNVWICGAGARRGGGVSGIPGHNAAQAVIAAAQST